MNSQTSLSATPHRDILAHYHNEVGKNIDALQALMPLMRDHDSLLTNRAAFAASLQSIRDMAMIHGFECVEAIAEKIESCLRSYDSENRETPEQFIRRLHQAIEILRQVVAMSDEREAQRLLRKAEYVMDYTIDNLALELRAEPDDQPADLATIAGNDLHLTENGAVNGARQEADGISDNDHDEYFDIREPELPLLKIVDEDAYRSITTGEKFGDEADKTAAIEAALDEILIKKLLHELDQLSAAIERVYISREGIHGIQAIRDHCAALKNESEKLGASVFNEVVFPLEQVARKCLQDEDDSALVLQTIARAEVSLRAYLLSPTTGAHELSALKAELETVLYLYEGQTDFPAARDPVSAFVDDDDLFNDRYESPNKQPVFSRLRRLFGMA
jgi:chemotaxis protein histidine kinase CheA